MIEPNIVMGYLDKERRKDCIAVIDDDEHVRALLKEVLEDEGYRVDLYHTTVNAHAWLLKTAPALLILDIRIEQAESGWLLLQELKGDPQIKDIPVIVCTAATRFVTRYSDQLEQFNCRIITKPFDLEVLVNLVVTALHVQP